MTQSYRLVEEGLVLEIETRMRPRGGTAPRECLRVHRKTGA